MKPSIILSQKDIHLIHALHVQQDHISPLDQELHRELMRLVAQAEGGRKGLTPKAAVGLYDAVTVNEISTPASDSMVCHIVLPHEADLEKGRFSILAPISMALLGRPLGTVVSLDAPAGTRQLRIDDIQKALSHG